MAKKYNSFKEFYPFYLSEHSNRLNRRLHWIGTFLLLCALGWIAYSGQWTKLWLIPLLGYGFAWFGHFFIEKNRPASFKQPIFSLMGDFVMFAQIATGKIRF